MSLSEYLSKNYLSNDRKRLKKSKAEKQHSAENANLTILETTIRPHETKSKTHTDREDRPSIRREGPKVPGWKVVGTDEILPELKLDTQSGDFADDHIRMASGAKAGLQMGEDVARQIKEKEDLERRFLKSDSAHSLGKTAETVFRDSSGRKIDIEAKREQERKEQEEKEAEKARRRTEINMGLIQKIELEEKLEHLRNSENGGINTYADDVVLNDKLRQKKHDDDPLLSFEPQRKKKYISRTGRKLYRGSYPENRFNIIPGWRWDGVDRSNGFEKAWFQKQQEIEYNKTQAYRQEEDY